MFSNKGKEALMNKKEMPREEMIKEGVLSEEEIDALIRALEHPATLAEIKRRKDNLIREKRESQG